MKERQINVQSLQGIPFRINADEEHLHPVLFGFKAVHQQFEMTQGGRADVGTGGVAKIGQGSGLKTAMYFRIHIDGTP